MISTFFLNSFFGLIKLILYPITLLTDVVISTDFSTAITTANGYLASFNSFIPLETVVNILLLFIAIEGGVLIYKLIMWGIKKIPTIN